MAFNSAKALIVILVTTFFAVIQARTVVVGGSENWRFGYNYTDWALKQGRFYINDTLVFNYDSSHDVYLLPDLWSYMKCDFRRGKLLANDAQGVGDGFKYVLNQFRPLYFACSKGVNASHCNSGMMKFFVMPLYKWRY